MHCLAAQHRCRKAAPKCPSFSHTAVSGSHHRLMHFGKTTNTLQAQDNFNTSVQKLLSSTAAPALTSSIKSNLKFRTITVHISILLFHLRNKLNLSWLKYFRQQHLQQLFFVFPIIIAMNLTRETVQFPLPPLLIVG